MCKGEQLTKPTSDVEDCVIFVRIHRPELLTAQEFVLDNRIFQKADAFGVFVVLSEIIRYYYPGLDGRRI